MKLRAVATTAFALLAFVFACAPASAEVLSVDHGGNYVGSVIVEPGQVVHGDLNVMGGDATIEGEVDGDVNVVGGNIYQRPGSVITGEKNSLGGDVTDMVVPWSAQHSYRNPFDYDGKLMWKIVWDVVAVFFFLVFPLRTRMALTRLEQHPGMCAVAGLLGWVAVIPLAIVLLCTILLIPFIAVEAVAVVAAVFLGKAALALLVGRRLCEVVSPKTTPSPFAALVVGLVMITAAELVPVIGAVVSVFVALIGLGAAILAFTGDSVIGVPVVPSAPRPPLSGPPMPIS
jgi:hypothetical protein